MLAHAVVQDLQICSGEGEEKSTYKSGMSILILRQVIGSLWADKQIGLNKKALKRTAM